MHSIEHYLSPLAYQLGISATTLAHIALTILIVVGYIFFDRIGKRVISRTVDDKTARYQMTRAMEYTLGITSAILILRVWISGITGFATYFGLVSAGIAVALQDPLTNFAGWLFIISRRPFHVGDRIQIDTRIGDVVDIRLSHFTMLEIGNWVAADQSTGRVIHVPNAVVFRQAIANYDRGFRYIWNELPVVVTFESNWRKAKDVLTRIANQKAEHLSEDAARQIDEAAQHYNIKFSKLTPVVWTSVVDMGVRLTMRYLCAPRLRRSSEHEIWESVLDEFSKMPDVDFAYPTTRYYDNRHEGKPEAGGVSPHKHTPKKIP